MHNSGATDHCRESMMRSIRLLKIPAPREQCQRCRNSRRLFWILSNLMASPEGRRDVRATAEHPSTLSSRFLGAFLVTKHFEGDMWIRNETVYQSYSLDCSLSSGSSQVPSRRSRTNDKGDREVGESPTEAPQRTLQSGDASIGDL